MQVNILGVNLTLRMKEDEVQLRQVIWLLKKRIEETGKRHKTQDPLTLAILTGLYLGDELINIKSDQYLGEAEVSFPESDRIINEELDRAFQRVLDVLESTVEKE